MTTFQKYINEYLVENWLQYVDDEIVITSWSSEKYEGEITDKMVETAKTIKKRIEKSEELVWYTIDWLWELNDWLYLKVREADWCMELCKWGWSNHVSTRYKWASTSWWPRLTMRKTKDWYSIKGKETRLIVWDGKKTNTVWTRRDTPKADWGMYFDVELNLIRLFF